MAEPCSRRATGLAASGSRRRFAAASTVGGLMGCWLSFPRPMAELHSQPWLHCDAAGRTEDASRRIPRLAHHRSTALETISELELHQASAETAAAAAPREVQGCRRLYRSWAYPAELLRPDGSLSQARVLRRVLVEELGLKPRDIVALFCNDGRKYFDLDVRSGSLLVSLGPSEPAAIVGRDAAWILSRGTSTQNIGERFREQYVAAWVQARSFSSSGGIPLAGAVAPPRQEELRPQAHSSRQEAARRRGWEKGGGSKLGGGWEKGLGGSKLGGGSRGELTGTALSEALPVKVPFALVATEALLVMFLEHLNAPLQQASAQGAKLLEFFSTPDSPEALRFNQLEVLRRTKQHLEGLREQAKALQTALVVALGDEDDLAELAAGMGGSLEEWELCFEHYSRTVEDIGSEASRQVESLDDLEKTISLRFSSRRLELEKLQLYLEVWSSSLSLGALLTGAFGMNLASGLEERRRVFWPVFVGIVVICLVLALRLQRFVCRRLRCHHGVGAGLPAQTPSGRRWTSTA